MSRPARIWPWISGVFVLMGVVSVGDALLLARFEGQPPTLAMVLVRSAPRWGVWALLAPGVVWLARRVAPDSQGPLRALLGQIPLLVVVLGIQLAASAAVAASIVMRALPEAPPAGHVALMYATSQLQVSILIYGVTVLSVWAWDWRSRLHARALAGATLERELAEARLHALRSHLNPHFLFNTLQAVSDMVPEDPDGAVRVIALLGDVLRGPLREAIGALIPLRQELHLLAPYLEIERIRFQDRLHLEFDFDPDLMDMPVPEFLLQPLIENAVVHGIGRREGPGRVRISTRRKDEVSAVVAVEDEARVDFPEPQDDGSAGAGSAEGGIGLGVTRARIRALYGDAARISLTPRPTGMLVEVVLPLRHPTLP